MNGVSVLSMNHDEVKALVLNAEDVLELEIERLAKIQELKVRGSISTDKSNKHSNSWWRK